MKYITEQTNPKDGKLLAIGHSMGGILLYALMSQYGMCFYMFLNCFSWIFTVSNLIFSLDCFFKNSYFPPFSPAFVGGDPKLSAVVTLASALDYTPSRSSLKLLLPLVSNIYRTDITFFFFCFSYIFVIWYSRYLHVFHKRQILRKLLMFLLYLWEP